MPWKFEKDPYKIWLSEIILQQTRVEQGTAYYLKFIHAFPTVEALAAAEDETVMKIWEGLGYYSRCRNLLHTARTIAEVYGGQFPNNYEELLKLKGVGPYTAAAIASFAFKLPYAVVDGNVNRILARYFGVQEIIQSTAGKKKLEKLAQEVLDPNNPHIHNQAMMDFGATICKPANPLCRTCALHHSCYAFLNKKVDRLPATAKKTSKKQRHFIYIIMFHKQLVYLKKRSSADIWQDMYEFALIETSSSTFNTTPIESYGIDLSIPTQPIFFPKIYTQQLSHQTIKARFGMIKLKKKPDDPTLQPVPIRELDKYPFPKIIRTFLTDYIDIFPSK